MKQIQIQTRAILLLLFSVLTASLIVSLLYIDKLRNIPPKEIIIDNTIHSQNILDEKIKVLEQELLSKLQKCETDGVKEPDGFVKLDSNDYLSWGKYQWQRLSVIYFVKTLYGEEISLQRAALIAWDVDNEIPLNELTSRVIFEIEDGIWEWANCAKKLKLETEVEFIKKLKN